MCSLNVSAPGLEMSGMDKSFPGVRVLDDVSLDLYPGEVHALMGENGEGAGAAAGVCETVFDGKRDASNQLNQIESAVSQGYKGIIAGSVSQGESLRGSRRPRRQTLRSSIPIITVAQNDSMAIDAQKGSTTPARARRLRFTGWTRSRTA